MRYVMLGTIHNHLTMDQRHAAMRRRAEWKYPEGIKLISEDWRASAPEVVSVFEANSYEPMLGVGLAWSDFMSIDISPSTTFEQGLAFGAKLVKK